MRINVTISARYIKIITVLAVLLFAVLATVIVREYESLQDIALSYGYAGVFLASIVSGFNIISVVPVVAFVPVFIAAGLHLWAVIAIIIIGTTIADMISYAIAYFGKQIMLTHIQKAIMRLEALRVRYHTSPMVALFFFAALVPLPNEILIIPMVFLGYTLRHILIPVLLGNALFTILSTLGVVSLFNLL